MFEKFTNQARDVMALANREVHGLRHDYIGTEHILLALLGEQSGMTALALKRLRVETDVVRGQIEKLVQPGTEPIAVSEIPLTPRAKRAIEFASQEAENLNQKKVDVEHLLMGLMREPEGVAGLVLRNLGLTLKSVGEEIYRLRILQLKIVECAVRPVRASTAGKRKMREELLAHLTTIYDQELERSSDPSAAMWEATSRFGDPAELSGELEGALPAYERRGYYFERWLGWRAPESAGKFARRVAAHCFLMMIVLCGLLAAIDLIKVYLRHQAWDQTQWVMLRPLAATLIFVPVSQFFLVFLYLKMRDAMWGAFGKRKSGFNAAAFAILVGLTVFAAFLGFFALGFWNLAGAFDLVYAFLGGGLMAAIGYYLQARWRGPTEIRDTFWACMDIEKSSGEIGGPQME